MVKEEEVMVDGSDGFLEEGTPYSLPGHTVSVQTDVIILTLDVKNVKPGSFVKQVKPSNMAVAFKFSSIGAGFVEIHHAFAIDFLIAGSMQEEAVEVEFWDNNVIVSLPLLAGMEAYKAGLSLYNLEEKLVSLGPNKVATEAEPKNKKRKGGKYKHEKHPKGMPQEEQDAEQEFHSRRKERHGSGDSLDSCMSESPMESVILKLAKEDDETSEKTEESCDEEVRLESPRYHRANSEDSTQVQPRGILKRKISGLVGSSRFRCYSESHLDEVGWKDATASQPSLSTTTISEDQVAEFNGSGKKSVRFNEKVQQQMYRVNSTILANTMKNKRKAEKKKRALERRMSEGDACSLEQADNSNKVEKKMTGSSSLDLNMVDKDDMWESEEHEDSGLASSFEEHLVLTGENPGNPGKMKAKKMTKKRSKQFVMSNELIFDLDI